MTLENATSVFKPVDNRISVFSSSANESFLFSLVENRTSMLRSVENETSVGTIENGTYGIIYSSEVERVLSLLCVGLSNVFTLAAQLLVVVTIIKSPMLHNAHFYLLGVYCCVDIALASLTGPHLIMRFSDAEVSTSACQVMASVTSIIVLGLTGHTAVVAYERYTFFCRPYHYEHRFKISRVAGVLVMCYTIPAVIIVIQGMMSDRTFHASSLSCILSDTPTHSGIIFICIMLPSATVTVYCTIRVWRLIRTAAVAPAAVENQPIPVPQAKKTLKMMLLLSGTFWGTTLPTSVVWTAIIMAGYTWDDLDSRRYMGPSIMMRLTVFMFTLVSSAVNPLIYYYSRRELRLATYKLLQCNRNTVHPEINEMT